MSYARIQYWKREGYFYVARIDYRRPNGGRGEIVKSLGFFSYHLIRLIHGDEMLVQMAQRFDPK